MKIGARDDASCRMLLFAIEMALGTWIGWVAATAILTADTLSTAISASAGLLVAVSTAKSGVSGVESRK